MVFNHGIAIHKKANSGAWGFNFLDNCKFLSGYNFWPANLIFDVRVYCRTRKCQKKLFLLELKKQ